MAYRRPGTAWRAPNRYDGTCARCVERVRAGTGEFRYDGSRWIVRHAGGRCHTPLYRDYIAHESVPWVMRRRARHEYAELRCEWWGLLSGRCPVSGELDCHHRHYRDLGHEPLSDLRMLCPHHHRMADARRRSWGSWPLFGVPWRSRDRARLRQAQEALSVALRALPAPPPPSGPPPPSSPPATDLGRARDGPVR